MSGYTSRVFYGFNSTNTHVTKTSDLSDIDLINADLNIAFQTRKAQRVMRPDYGCAIWDYLMEPGTDYVRDQIRKEATRICSTDSRLVIQNIDVYQQSNGIRIEITLLYQPYSVVYKFQANFQNSNTAYYQGALS